jgi:hypothetical protein
MTHLSELELVDHLDDALPASRAVHLESCAGCRERADTLRHAMASVLRTAEDVPEPSPLFWEHFSQRVRDAVHHVDPAEASWARWIRAPLGWAAVSVVALLAVATIFRAGAPRSETPRLSNSAALEQPSAADAVPVDLDNLDNDEEWALVRVVAEDLGWEDAHEAGISARPGSADRVALEMSPAERQELARLLEDEITRTGA